MAKPEIHSQSSAKKYGGRISDYQMIHQFFDSSKASFPNNGHRAILHHSFGTFLAEQMFGIDFDAAEDFLAKYNLPPEALADLVKFKDDCTQRGTMRLNSDGRKFSVRDVGEQHCLEDFRNRFIPTVQDYLEEMPVKPWMNNAMAGDVPRRLKIDKTSELKAGDAENTHSKVMD